MIILYYFSLEDKILKEIITPELSREMLVFREVRSQDLPKSFLEAESCSI